MCFLASWLPVASAHQAFRLPGDELCSAEHGDRLRTVAVKALSDGAAITAAAGKVPMS